MSEFKANGYVPKTANDLAAEHYERAKSGKNNPAFFAGAKHVIRLEYQPLYNAYTTTSAELDYYKNRVEAAEKGRTDSTNAHVQTIAELETVKAELDRGKWISVSDKLPDGEVIATNGFEMIIGYVSRQEDLFIAAYEDLELPNVTHWQPLPTPPHKN